MYRHVPSAHGKRLEGTEPWEMQNEMEKKNRISFSNWNRVSESACGNYDFDCAFSLK